VTVVRIAGSARGGRQVAPLVAALLTALALVGCSGSGGSGATSAEPTPLGSAPDAAAASTRPTGTAPVDVSLEGAGLPTRVPDAVLARVPTRVRVAELGIDLPVIAPPTDPAHYPFCDVAEFLPALSRPGRAGATFLYAHARPGMFLPILEESRVRDGRSMVGLEVEVWTSDDRRFTYRVTDVRRHVVSLDFAYRATAPQLMLQTSEGPHGTIPKTMLIAEPDDEAAATHDAAHPEPHPVSCR
jgi:hypothetical protein